MLFRSDIIICFADTIIQLIQPSHAIRSPTCINKRNESRNSGTDVDSKHYSLTYDRGKFILYNHNASYINNVNPLYFSSYDLYLEYVKNKNKDKITIPILPNPNPPKNIRKNYVIRSPYSSNNNTMNTSRSIIPENTLDNEFKETEIFMHPRKCFNSHIINTAPLINRPLNGGALQPPNNSSHYENKENIGNTGNTGNTERKMNNNYSCDAMSSNFHPVAANFTDYCGGFMNYQ